MSAQHTPPKEWRAVNVTGHQGLIVCDRTGANIAVSYDKEHAPLLASAPELLAALHLIYANAGESPEWIRARITPAISKAEGRA